MKQILIFFLLIFISSPSFAATKIWKSIIISSYHKELEQKREMIDAIVDNHRGTIEKILYIDSKRNELSTLDKKKQKFISIIDSRAIDLVYLCDDNALKLFGNELAKRKVTIIFLGINNNPRAYFSENNIPKNVHGILEKSFFKRGVAKLSSFFKNSNKSTIIFDNSETSKIIISEMFKDSSSTTISGVIYKYEIVNTTEELKHSITEANLSNSYLIAGPIHTIKNKKGKIQDFREILTIINRYSNTPFFGFWKDYVGEQHAMAAYGVSLKVQGESAAMLASEVMDGSSSHKIVTPQRGELFISKSQFKQRNYPLPTDRLY